MRPGIAGLALGLLALGAGEVTAQRPVLELRAVPPERIEIGRGGNRLVVSRRASVPFQTLTACLDGLERELPASHTAFQVARAWPADVVEYVLCVVPEGTLVLGQQVHQFDRTVARWMLRRDGAIADGPVAYQPLDDGRPWRWMVSVPLSREALATLEIRATELAWPVKSVRIDARLAE